MIRMIRYRQARPYIRTGDVALLRNRGPIEATSQGPWTHAAVCWWADSTLWLAEVREFHGGRIVTFSSQVRDYPGRWDVFRPRCHPTAAIAAAQMIARQAGHPYGWRAVARALALRLPVCRLAARGSVHAYQLARQQAPPQLVALDAWLNPDTSDTTAPSAWDEPKHCSQTVAWGFRLVGEDLVPRKHDRYIEPADLGHSAALTLKFEGLVP